MEAKRISMNRLYGDLAYLWPVLSPPADYSEEAGHWLATLREFLGADRRRVLELGVGGGHNLSHLTFEFEATAVDISEAMLDHSRRLNPAVTHHLGDMRNVRLGRKFDAVLIHDAVDYLLSERDLAATFATAAAHLAAGGVLVMAPDHFRDSFHGPYTDHRTNASADMQLTYFEYTYDPDPEDTTVETIYTYYIQRQGELQIEHDRHVTGLFPKSTWARLLSEAGFRFAERSYYLIGESVDYTLLVGRLEHIAPDR